MNEKNATVRSVRNRRISPETIVDLYIKENLTTDDISRSTGYTRQRVGQILREQGVDVIGESRLRRLATRRKRAEERQILRDRIRKEAVERAAQSAKETSAAKYLEWRRRWSEGKTAAQIAAFEGLALENVKGVIRRLRIRYNWFMNRRKCK